MSLLLATPLAANPPLAELSAMVERGEPRQALREIARILRLRTLPDGHDRGQLLLIKAEAHLRLGQVGLVNQSLEAALEHLPDGPDADQAASTLLLLRRAGGVIYRPRMTERGRRADPIDLVDPRSRRQALEVFWIDQRDQIERAAGPAASGDTLPPMLELLDSLKPLSPLERHLTGSDQFVQNQTARLQLAAITLIGQGLQTMQTKLESIDTRARQPIEDPQKPGRSHQAGLGGDDAHTLRSIILDASKVEQILINLAEDVGLKHRQTLQRHASQSQAIQSRARQILATDYTTPIDP